MNRIRLRELGINIGRYKTGEYNAITDVAGIKVGHVTLNETKEDGAKVRTGVTAILPHGGNLFKEKVIASTFVINGFGKTVGTIQVEELGVIESPILLTNTLSVSAALEGTIRYLLDQNPEIGNTTGTVNVVVGECNDGYLNDIRGLHVKPEHAREAIEKAAVGPVEEGCVGAGTGMSCLGFKGGIGTSSRQTTFNGQDYTIGALVLSNYGKVEHLRTPNNKLEDDEEMPDGSIMIILATDAPLSDRQLKRLAKRASFGLSRTGSHASNGSGDIVIAFSTAHQIPHDPKEANNTQTFNFLKEDGPFISELFEMTVDAVEEAIWNSLCMATTTIGQEGKSREAIPYDLLEALKS